MAKPQLPKTRRLTRPEAKRLGVSWSAKRRVSADVKRVTRKTKIYTDRQVAEAKHGKRREAVAKENTEKRTTKAGKNVVEHRGLSKQNLIRILKKNHGRYVVVKYRGVKGTIASDGHFVGTSDDDDDDAYQWFSGYGRVEASGLETADGFKHYTELSKISGETSYGVIIYK